MAGHSKWSQIKHEKGITDARRGQVFTKLAREVAVAVREGGSSPDSNYRLRLAIQKARDNNMPMENIERAIKRASGGNGHESLEEVTYEGYGPGGVAFMVQVLTSNRNRAVSEVRSTLTRAGGSLGAVGCVAWNFQPKGVITLEADLAKVEETALAAIDAGAEDVKVEGSYVEIHTATEGLETVRHQLEAAGVSIGTAEISRVARNTIRLDEKTALQALRLLDLLEELPDIQKVYTNADFSIEVLERYGSER